MLNDVVGDVEVEGARLEVIMREEDDASWRGSRPPVQYVLVKTRANARGRASEDEK